MQASGLLSERKLLKQRQTLVYIMPVIGLWMIFLLWIVVKTNSGGNSVGPSNIEMGNSQNSIVASNNRENNTKKGKLLNNGGEVSTKIKIMTWNIQGLMGAKLEARTKAIIDEILVESPDVVFFQELISSSYNELSRSLQESYANVIGTKKDIVRYFTGIFYKKTMYTLDNHEIIPFANSVMDRTKLIVKISSRVHSGVRLALLTSHLESLPRFSKQRLVQLKECFETSINFPNTYNVIFAGDLNLEENEEAGSVPETLKDLWIEGGSLDSTKYTWDSTQNQNELPGDVNQQPRVRYDRMYFRSSAPPTLRFEKFELKGKTPVAETSYYPSDHWAIMSTFVIN